jgi:hypothetical protein
LRNPPHAEDDDEDAFPVCEAESMRLGRADLSPDSKEFQEIAKKIITQGDVSVLGTIHRDYTERETG